MRVFRAQEDAKFTFLPFSVKPECYLIYLKSIGYVYGGAVKFCFLAYKERTARSPCNWRWTWHASWDAARWTYCSSTWRGSTRPPSITSARCSGVPTYAPGGSACHSTCATPPAWRNPTGAAGNPAPRPTGCARCRSTRG